jgi:RHS repeat-associated protein
LECAIDNQSSGNYLYDANGSLKKDVQGQIDTIKYDYRGLPLEIKKAGTSTYYRYNAEGQRVFKQTGTGVSTYYIADISGKTLAVVKSNTGYPVFNLWGNDHIGQLQVGYGVNGSIVVQGLETPLVVQPRSDTRYYFLKDHLGSVRVTVDVSGNVTSYDDFYPFGMTMDGRSGNFGSGDARYKYTTKERDAESGYDYFGARYYDARIGRWMAADPLAERYLSFSPYDYSLCNPIRGVDPDGARVLDAIQGYAKGLFVSGPVNMATGILNAPAALLKLVEHPMQSLSAMGTAASDAWSTITGPSSPTRDFARGEAIGEIAFNVAVAAATAGVGSEMGGGEGLASAGATQAESGSTWARMSGMLRDAAEGKGNFSLGSATTEEAGVMGKAWVGEGYEVAKDGVTLISKDGLRQYRPPSLKPKLGSIQANFERRIVGQKSKAWQSNAHLDIIEEVTE